MKFVMPLFAAAILCAGAAQAQVELKTYADAKGNLDVQALTCAQLANTFQEDADFMTVWYSGWYNGLANYSKLKVDRAKEHRAPGDRVLQGASGCEGHQSDGYQHQANAQGSRHQGQRRAINIVDLCRLIARVYRIGRD